MSTDTEYRPWQVETRVGKQWVRWSTYHDWLKASHRREALAAEPGTRARIVNLATGQVLEGDSAPSCPHCDGDHQPPYDGMCLI